MAKNFESDEELIHASGLTGYGDRGGESPIPKSEYEGRDGNTSESSKLVPK